MPTCFPAASTPMANQQQFCFWNGNKSPARQAYEWDLLQACLAATEHSHGLFHLTEDKTDYPLAEDEGRVLEGRTDVLVTVAGNVKFTGRDKLVVPRALSKGLLGYRLLIINQHDSERFAAVSTAQQLQQLSIGIPQTWADAELFRQNHYQVREKGSFDELFDRLRNGECDYTALGANEIELAMQSNQTDNSGLIIEPSIMLYYPYPLVFYVSPQQPLLAQRIQQGIDLIQADGQFDALFTRYHGNVVERLGLAQRKLFTLENPIYKTDIADFTPSLLGSAANPDQ